MQHVLPHLDYREQSLLAAASRPLKSSRQVSFIEAPFTQHDFSWTLTIGAKTLKVTSSCTAVALAAIVEFYESPKTFVDNWWDLERWQRIISTGAQWHERFVKSKMDDQLFLALGPEATHVSPEEMCMQASSGQLPIEFAGLVSLQQQRAIICLTDICVLCGGTGPSGKSFCDHCGGNVVQGAPSSLETCCQLMGAHVGAIASEPCGFVVVAGERSFAVVVGEGKYIVPDSHYRSWTGQPIDSSLLVAGKWVDRADFSRLLGKAIGQGPLGYKADVPARLFAWMHAGSGFAKEDVPPP